MASPVAPATPTTTTNSDSNPSSEVAEGQKPAATPQRTTEEVRADQLFGEEGEENSEAAKSARAFGVTAEWRGRGNRNNHVKAKPIPPKVAKSTPAPAEAGAAKPAAGAEALAQATEEGQEAGAEAPADPLVEEGGQEQELAPFEYKHTTYHLPANVVKYVKSMQGQFPAFDRKTREAVKLAHDWKAAHDQVMGQLTELRNQKQSQPQSSPQAAPHPQSSPQRGAAQPPAEAPVSLSSAIDWKAFQEVYRTDPTTAMQWMADLQDQVLEERLARAIKEITGRLDTDLAPTREAQERRQQLQRVSNFFSKMSEMVFDDGSEAYPDMGDEGFVVDLHNVWNQIPESPYKHTPQAFHAAYLTTVDYWSRGGKELPSKRGATSRNQPQSTPSPSTSSDNSPAAHLLREVAADRSGAVLDGGGAATTPRPGAHRPATPPNRGDALLESIGKAGKRDSVFGVVLPGNSR